MTLNRKRVISEMTNLCQVILTVALTITITNGVLVIKPRKGAEENRFALPEKEKFPSTNFIPSNLKISEEVYDNLLNHLADQLSEENVNIKANGLFPKGKITC